MPIVGIALGECSNWMMFALLSHFLNSDGYLEKSLAINCFFNIEYSASYVKILWQTGMTSWIKIILVKGAKHLAASLSAASGAIPPSLRPFS
jgi:hypothetical protein